MPAVMTRENRLDQLGEPLLERRLGHEVPGRSAPKRPRP
jgi:hypothetical protein